MIRARRDLIGRGLLLFWSVWLSVVFASNLTDAMRETGFLPATWRFASGNFALVRKSIEIYPLGDASAALLFGAVVLVQLGAATLFWRAFLDGDSVARPDAPNVLRAFGASIGLFAAFLVADELFVVYDRLPGVGTTHLLVLCALLLSHLVVRASAGPRA